MKVIYTDAHLGHNPQQEIAESGSHSPHEHTARAENIRETLQARSEERRVGKEC